MAMVRGAAFATVVMAGACVSLAEVRADNSLSGDTVRSLIAGKTVLIETPAGEVPVRFNPNGTMSGQSGTLAVVAGAASDVGRWWVSADRLCQRWRVWLGGEAECVTLHRRGAAFLWRAASGREGRARIAH